MAPEYRPLMLAQQDRAFAAADRAAWAARFPAREWAMERKYDGWRCLVSVRDHTVSAWHRAGRDAWGQPRSGLPWQLPPHLVAALSGLDDCDLDGEMMRHDQADAALILFDILAAGADDLTAQSYTVRRLGLEAIAGRLPAGGPVTVIETGRPDPALYAEIIGAGGEGVVLKRVASPYRGQRSNNWVKVKARES